MRTQLPPKGRRSEPVDWGPPIEIKSLDGWRYDWHEQVLKRPDLPRSAIAVAGALMHAYRTDRGYAEIGLATLAERAGCSRSITHRATVMLRRKGLIAALNEGQRKPDGSLPIYRYRLIYAARGVP